MGQDRHRERLVVAVDLSDAGGNRFARQRPDACFEPGGRAGSAGRLVHREGGPDQRRGADVARAARGVAESTVVVLVRGQPPESVAYEGIVSADQAQRRDSGGGGQRARRELALVRASSRRSRQAEVAHGEEGIVGVFTIRLIIRPGAAKGLAGP